MFNAIKYLYKLNSHDIRNSFIVTIIYIYIYIYVSRIHSEYWIPTIRGFLPTPRGKNGPFLVFQAGDDDEEATSFWALMRTSAPIFCMPAMNDFYMVRSPSWWWTSWPEMFPWKQATPFHCESSFQPCCTSRVVVKDLVFMFNFKGCIRCIKPLCNAPADVPDGSLRIVD